VAAGLAPARCRVQARAPPSASPQRPQPPAPAPATAPSASGPKRPSARAATPPAATAPAATAPAGRAYGSVPRRFTRPAGGSSRASPTAGTSRPPVGHLVPSRNRRPAGRAARWGAPSWGSAMGGSLVGQRHGGQPRGAAPWGAASWGSAVGAPSWGRGGGRFVGAAQAGCVLEGASARSRAVRPPRWPSATRGSSRSAVSHAVTAAGARAPANR
jgi:hypothetical protein